MQECTGDVAQVCWVGGVDESNEIVDVDLEEGEEFGIVGLGVVGRNSRPVDVHHDVFHWMWWLRGGGAKMTGGDIAGCFGGSAEKRRAFAPSHLKGVGYDESGLLVGVVWWQNVGEVPCVVRVDYHAPIAVF